MKPVAAVAAVGLAAVVAVGRTTNLTAVAGVGAAARLHRMDR